MEYSHSIFQRLLKGENGSWKETTRGAQSCLEHDVTLLNGDLLLDRLIHLFDHGWLGETVHKFCVNDKVVFKVKVFVKNGQKTAEIDEICDRKARKLSRDIRRVLEVLNPYFEQFLRNALGSVAEPDDVNFHTSLSLLFQIAQNCSEPPLITRHGVARAVKVALTSRDKEDIGDLIKIFTKDEKEKSMSFISIMHRNNEREYLLQQILGNKCETPMKNLTTKPDVQKSLGKVKSNFAQVQKSEQDTHRFMTSGVKRERRYIPDNLAEQLDKNAPNINIAQNYSDSNAAMAAFQAYLAQSYTPQQKKMRYNEAETTSAKTRFAESPQKQNHVAQPKFVKTEKTSPQAFTSPSMSSFLVQKNPAFFSQPEDNSATTKRSESVIPSFAPQFQETMAQRQKKRSSENFPSVSAGKASDVWRSNSFSTNKTEYVATPVTQTSVPKTKPKAPPTSIPSFQHASASNEAWQQYPDYLALSQLQSLPKHILERILKENFSFIPEPPPTSPSVPKQAGNRSETPRSTDLQPNANQEAIRKPPPQQKATVAPPPDPSRSSMPRKLSHVSKHVSNQQPTPVIQEANLTSARTSSLASSSSHQTDENTLEQHVRKFENWFDKFLKQRARQESERD